MVSDALAQFTVGSVTRTSTTREAFRQVLPGGTPRKGNTIRVIYTNALNVSGANSITFSADVSWDGGSTWMQEFFSDTISLNTVAKQGEIYIPYRVVGLSPPTAGPAPQVALSVNFSGAGSGPTITFIADHSVGGPA